MGLRVQSGMCTGHRKVFRSILASVSPAGPSDQIGGSGNWVCFCSGLGSRGFGC